MEQTDNGLMSLKWLSEPVLVTAARRYLKTLKYLGYLETDEHYFWLTHRVLRFSSSYLSSAHLPKVAQSF